MDDLQQIERDLAAATGVLRDRIANEHLRFYVPHAKQLEFHKSKAPVRAFFASNQTGKTFCGAIDDLWTLGGVHPYRPNYRAPVRGRVCCVKFQVLRQVLLVLFQRFAPRNPCRLEGLTYEGKPRMWPGLRGYNWKDAFDRVDMVLHLADGSPLEFKSYDQDLEAFAGAPLDFIHPDEEPPENMHRENQARQLTTGVDMRFTLTPLKYSQWLYNEVYQGAAESDDIFVVQASYHDNPHIDEKVVESIKNSDMDEAERAARLYGAFTYTTGRIWKTYGSHNFVDYQKLPDRYTRVLSIDPHRDKDDFANLVAWDSWRGSLYFYRELRASGDIHERIAKVRKLCFGENIDIMVIDPSAEQGVRSLSEKNILDFYTEAFPTIMLADNSRGAKDHSRAVIERLAKKSPSGETNLYVMRNCPRTHHQFLNYSYKPPGRTGEDRKQPAIFKKNEDHCDNAIQAVQFLPVGRELKRFKQMSTGLYANG